MRYRHFLLLLTLVGVFVSSSPAQEPRDPRIPVLFDTDLGSDVGDALALALIEASPELRLEGVTTVSGDTNVRAMMCCRWLTMTGRRHTPVAAGAAPQPKREFGGQYGYYNHPDVLFDRTSKPVKQTAVEFLYERIHANKGEIVIICGGPLTNIARLLKEKPDCKPWIKRLIVTEGDVDQTKSEVLGHNWKADEDAFQSVLGEGMPIVIVPKCLIVVSPPKSEVFEEPALRRIFAPKTTLSLQAEALHQLCAECLPGMSEVVAVALALNLDFLELKGLDITVDDRKNTGQTLDAFSREKFDRWYLERMENTVTPASRPVSFIEPGKLLRRVHVAEDFETDAERRWWMAGKPETENVPPGSTRACRGTLTHDFDDLLGNPRAMYTAVIFNPVPGPPMGANTRLGFRYWLKGSDTLRVQLYSLSRGFHRHLVVKNVPQRKWEYATVDLTHMRRPDGTGGPLAEHERIDDIQFYVDPAAEIIIDDIVLYEAAADDEKDPFPKHVVYRAVFDTGKQGAEWPGTFTIEENAGNFWKAAKSVENADLKRSWIRLDMKGQRTLVPHTKLRFRAKPRAAGDLEAFLENTKSGARWKGVTKLSAPNEWQTVTLDIPGLSFGDSADELHFWAPAGSELRIDDVILYTSE